MNTSFRVLARTHQSPKNQGFTLVEMAIVLVIIGLLLGGVLKGQELVVQARVKSLINDYNQVTAAYYTYFDRYKRFPGDDNTAATRWSGAPVGDGSGIIGTAAAADNFDSGEAITLWRHLRYAGIVAGDKTATTAAAALPVNSVGGQTGIREGAYGISETVICQTRIPNNLAELIDYAIDDGRADQGILQGGSSSTTALGTVGTSNTTATGYGTAGNYVVCRKL